DQGEYYCPWHTDWRRAGVHRRGDFGEEYPDPDKLFGRIAKKFCTIRFTLYICALIKANVLGNGELAQLARALHWQCRGHRFESVILHKSPSAQRGGTFYRIETESETNSGLLSDFVRDQGVSFV